MSHLPPLVESPAAAPRGEAVVEAGPARRKREVIVTARWSVHACSATGEALAAATVAGATVEACSEAAARASNGSPDGCCFMLTFWRQNDPAGARARDILAVYATDPDRLPALEGAAAAKRADFQLAVHQSFMSLDVMSDRPVLRLTHGDQAPARVGAPAFCRSILPELLGLRGGQYRLDDLRVDRARLLQSAVRLDRARRAV